MLVMIPVIEAIMRFFSYRAQHAREHVVLDRTIAALGRSDQELERRLQELRAQAEVITRSTDQDDDGAA